MKIRRSKQMYILWIISVLILLMAAPALSQDDDDSPGRGRGRGNNNNTQETSDNSGGEEETNGNLLGCQKNNPERLDCSSLEVSGVCEGNVAVFTIRNTGEAGNGDMISGTEYRILQDGAVVETGIVQLDGASTMEIRWEGGGEVMLQADQQIGHPGSSEPRVTLNCGDAPPPPEPTQEVTPEPTPEVTDEPTPEVTPEPTQEVTPEPTPEVTQEPPPPPPDLDYHAECDENGAAVFIITNNGGDMLAPSSYQIVDAAGMVLQDDTFQLMAGESTTRSVPDYPGLVMMIVDGVAVAAIECTPPEPEPDPIIETTSWCEGNGTAVFEITNIGGSMTEPMSYELVTEEGEVLTGGEFQLGAGESTLITLHQVNGTVILSLNGEWVDGTYCEYVPPTEPELVYDAWCEDDGTATFEIWNIGTDMTWTETYEIANSDGLVVLEGEFQLMANESATINVGQSGWFELYIAGMAEIWIHCDPPVEPDPPNLIVDIHCEPDGAGQFIISNDGGDMLAASTYQVVSLSGDILSQDTFMLAANGQEIIPVASDDAEVSLYIDGQWYASIDCPEPPPPPDPPELALDAICEDDGTAVFTISNNGGDMPAPVYYAVTDANNTTLDSGWVQLFSGGSMDVSVAPGAGMVTLTVDGTLTLTIECDEPTPEPTPEVTPEPTPEVTPEPPPPNDEPLGCQKNNRDRLDCSSLEVSAHCEGDTAVFVITNTGEAGDGDMRAPTEYRVIVDGQVVEAGTLQIDGNTTIEVWYDGGGRVTLEADQQIGHPGNSQPQATINCGG